MGEWENFGKEMRSGIENFKKYMNYESFSSHNDIYIEIIK